jgi:hypothetical protein
MTKTTGQRIVEEWATEHSSWVQIIPTLRDDLIGRIDQALETANAEVERLREALRRIADNTFDIPGGHGDSFAVNVAREARDKKE